MRPPISHLHERPVWCRRLRRDRWLKAIEETVEPGCEIGMGSCGGAHHWARELQAKGYVVKLIPLQFVKLYVKSNKNDANDAAAICEAMSRPSMRYVAVKTIEQQDLQAMHRVRASLLTGRTAKANQIRGLVCEYGLVAPKELGSLRRALPVWLEDAANGLSARFRALLAGLFEDLQALDVRVTEMDRENDAIARGNDAARRLHQLRGVGPLTATALLAAVGDARQFTKGRQLSAALGLTPHQHSSGGKERHLGISKRGDKYLRTLLIHGAHSAIRTAKDKPDRLSRWVTALAERSHPNVAAAALASKTARIAWAC